ncbi:hypothetical protein V3471_00550 [Flavobacterium oreochromis]|uniref:hypothetical protein n=1 Tax=Flavobacterium oreochromis TaxID=2906078 RepID=UPI000CDB4D91|nr:hypothetical protein BWK58_06635 [Flavobacterium columnare]
MKTKIIVLVMLGLLFSCKTAKPIEQEQNQKTIETIVKDTVIEVQADSTFYKALIECQNNKPVLIEKDLANVKPIFKEPLKIRTKLVNGMLTVDCKKEAQKLFLQWKEKHISETKIKTVVLPPKLIKKPLTWWETLWCSLGKFFTSVFCLWLIYKIVKLWKRLALPLP